MTAVTAPQLTHAQPLAESTTKLLQAAEAIRKYLRRIPPDSRSGAFAALAELEGRILEVR